MDLAARIESDGFALLESAIPEETLQRLDGELRPLGNSARHVLRLPAVREAAGSHAVRRLITPVLGPHCFAVRAQWFNKMSGANWYVTWHQDRVIAVREKKFAPGFSAWSVKDEVPHVHPPARILEHMLAIRIHLDDSTTANGPLKVIPGSHLKGVISESELSLAIVSEKAVACTAPRGSAVVLRPLLLHASPAAETGSRGVLHIEFAAEELPQGLQWHDRVE